MVGLFLLWHIIVDQEVDPMAAEGVKVESIPSGGENLKLLFEESFHLFEFVKEAAAASRKVFFSL